MTKKKQHIDLEDDRYGLFMSENSFNLDVEYGRDYLQTDHVDHVTLYKVNVTKTKSHKLYGQSKAKDKVFFSPVKLNVMVNVLPSEQKYYGDNPGGIARQDTGNLSFGVYLDELKEKKVDMIRGDYIEYNMSGDHNRYYEIQNADIITDTTDKTIGGFKPYFKRIVAVPVKEDVLPFISETKGN